MNTMSEFDEIWKRLRFYRFERLLWYIEIDVDKTLRLKKILGEEYLQHQGEMFQYIVDMRTSEQKAFFAGTSDAYNIYFSSSDRREKTEWLRKTIQGLLADYRKNIRKQSPAIREYARGRIACQ